MKTQKPMGQDLYLFHVYEYSRSEYEYKYKYWAVKNEYIASKYKYLKFVLECKYKYQVLQLWRVTFGYTSHYTYDVAFFVCLTVSWLMVPSVGSIFGLDMWPQLLGWENAVQ